MSNNTLHVRFQNALNNNPELVVKILEVTKFLKYSANLKVRLQCLIKGITSQPLCKICNGVLQMRTSGPLLYTFGTYCSSKCAGQDPEIQCKRIQTNIEKYGAATFLHSEEGQKQSKQSIKQRYGVDNVMHVDTIKAKRDATNLERYGNINPATTEQIKKKKKTTNLERYGTENSLSSNSIRDKVANTMMERYGVDNPFKLQKFQDRADETMLERYGVESPIQNDKLKDKINQSMVERYGNIHYHTSQIDPDMIIYINDKNWLTEQHVTKQKTIERIAEECGVSSNVITQALKKHDIPVQFRNTSQGERDIVSFIASIYTGEVVCNNRTILGSHELDVYLPEKKIAFEFNGVFWHSELNGKRSNYHIEKTNKCNEKGIQLIHILDSEWNTKQEIVKSRIRSRLGVNSTIPARKCTVVQLNSTLSRTFFNTTHIQGFCSASVVYGLMCNNEIVAVMSFGKARYNKKVQWELLRYSNQLNVTIVGGAGKLFNHFVRTQSPTSITTYSDKRWNTGNMYEKIGFTKQHSAKPNYYYFQPHDTTKLYHRSQFQKHKLHKLPQFDPVLTEWQNMVNNGFDRIWDCGNDVFVWNQPS